MAVQLPVPIKRIVSSLSSLQGIGPRLAQRLALQLLSGEERRVRELSEALTGLVDRIRFCPTCGFLNETEVPCPICSDQSRDRSIILVTEDPQDVLVVDASDSFHGLFHVLGGALSPMDGIGPGDIRIRELLDRLRDGTVQEVIIATNPTMEGDATALYLHDAIAPLGTRVSRIARGLPSGGNLEYADRATLGDAIEGRREF